MPMTEAQRNGVVKALARYAALSAQCVVYHWDYNFAASELNDCFKNLVNEISKLEIDFNNLSKEDCALLGCSSEYLIPLYLYDVVSPDTKIIDIFGNEESWGKGRNNDTRYGYLSCAFKPIDEPHHFLKNPNKSETSERNYDEIKKWLAEQIDNLTDENNCYEVSPTSYDDYISEATLLTKFNEYCENNKNHNSFSDYLVEYFWNEWIDADDYLYDVIKSKAAEAGLEDAYEAFCEDCGSDREALYTCGYNGTNIKIEEFLEHDYKIDLMLATENELNYNMGSISDYYIEPERFVLHDPSKDKRWDNALTYIIRQQGHTPDEIIEAYNKLLDAEDKKQQPVIEDKFIKSTAEELYDWSTFGCGELTALVKLSGQNLLDVLTKIAKKEGNIMLLENTTIGIYDEWNGAGSQLDIQLSKPFIFPASMVRNVQIEKAGRNLNRGWSVDDTYGLVGSCWKDSCKVTDVEPTLAEFKPCVSVKPVERSER